jgi:hypothetical protein
MHFGSAISDTLAFHVDVTGEGVTTITSLLLFSIDARYVVRTNKHFVK